jgi:hypothetical protein
VKNAYNFLIEESGRMRLLERSDRKWENNIKMDLKETVSVY